MDDAHNRSLSPDGFPCIDTNHGDSIGCPAAKRVCLVAMTHDLRNDRFFQRHTCEKHSSRSLSRNRYICAASCTSHCEGEVFENNDRCRKNNRLESFTHSGKSKFTMRHQAAKSFRRHWQLYLVVIPPLLYFLVFKYIPMVNAVIAFKDYSVVLGIWGSPWAGFKHFRLFFENPVFWRLVQNTFYLSLYALAVGFPIPIILALCLNEVGNAASNASCNL